MASRFPSEDNGQLRTRRGHDIKWSCDMHGEPIKFYCKDHTIPICHPCATKDHVKKQCRLQDIEDVILEMRNNLEDTQTKIGAAKKRLKTQRSKLESVKTSASNYLQSVKDNVNATYDGKMNSVKNTERDEIRLINDEADEEIRIINEKREKRIKACKVEAEKQLTTIKESEVKLISDIQTISGIVNVKINELKSKNQHYIDIGDNMDSRIERIKQNDEKLVNGAPQVIASLDESLCSNVHQEVADYLDRIEREVQRVKFVEVEVGGEHYGRIDGYVGKWELVKAIDIAWIAYSPMVRGLVSGDEICVRGVKGFHISYVTNISTGETAKVTEGGWSIYITSCALVSSNIIVCGKLRSYSSNGFIALYDRQWKVIRDINIPTNTFSLYSPVYLDVDRDEMIIAAQCGQSKIYVINPTDGKIVNTITMKGNKRVSKFNSIQVLSSGNIVVETGVAEFTVISRSGEEKNVIHCDEWKDSRCYVDNLIDTLYISYWDKERMVYAVDQVSCDGNIQARRIVKNKPTARPYDICPCLVTPSGSLVACDGEKLLVYKKSFIL